jgi:hypothetical protein
MKSGFFLLSIGLVAVLVGGCVEGLVGDGVGLPDNNESAMQVTVGSNFVSARRTGTATGAEEVEICDGWFPNEPNNVLQIDASLGMTIKVTSDDDVRLWMLAGQSNFCGDGATVQEISRFWTRGTIDVYVGTPGEGETVDYVLEFIPD